MKRFFTSDLHFGHRNVIPYCNRPYTDIQDMEEKMINQWNSQVAPEDEVYFLGDFGINKKKIFDKELVSKLNGTKHLILGNHDAGFVRSHKNGQIPETVYNKATAAGWSTVSIEITLELEDDLFVVMTHLPPSNEHDQRYGQFKLKNRGSNYLHGHLHGHYRKKNNLIDVCFDGDLKLLSENDIINLIYDERDFIPTRLTESYEKEMPLILRPFEYEVKQKNLRRVESTDGKLVLYNYTDHCAYERDWNETTKAARGIIFEKETGKIVALPFPKFFNIGEMPETRLENLPNEGYTVSEKMDGSLGIIYHYDNKWRVATRGSFESEQAQEGQKMLDSQYDTHFLDTNYTYLVEIIYPENKIVVNYGNERKLVLLGIVNNDTLEEIKLLPYTIKQHPAIIACGFEYVNLYNYTIDEMLELQKTLPKDEEGFVIKFDSGLRVKIKGHEYLRIHKLISQMSPLSFWESMKDGKVDIEYLEELPEEYRKDAEILTKQLESKYYTTLNEVQRDYIAMLNILQIDASIDSHENKKKIGLYIKDKKLKHNSAMFPMFLKKSNAVDKYILKQIRPTGNVL